MHGDDVRLLEATADGDVGAFEELFRRYHQPVAGFVFKMTGRRELVEELVNDVMIVVWQKAHTFAGRSKVSTWIMGVAYRKALKAIQRLGRTPSMVEIEPEMTMDPEGPESDLAAGERRARIRALLAELSPAHRAVIELTYYYGCSYREIARIVGCPENTVKTRMFHARKRLRSLLRRTRSGQPQREGRMGC